jgi:hypothetical protein
MRNLKTKTCIDQQCLQKGKEQLLSAFPVNRRIPDGRHRYCRACCVRRVHEGRARRREREAAQKKVSAAPLPVWQPGIRVELRERDARVLEAIRAGARTQEEIKREAKVETLDEVGLSLAELILCRRMVRSTLTGAGDRQYFISNAPAIARVCA